MSYWVYDPKKLVSPSSLIPYKSSDSGEIFNFLTLFILAMSGYLHSTGELDKNLNLVFLIFITTFVLGVATGFEKEEKNEFVFGKYEDSLKIY